MSAYVCTLFYTRSQCDQGIFYLFSLASFSFLNKKKSFLNSKNKTQAFFSKSKNRTIIDLKNRKKMKEKGNINPSF